MTPSLKALIEQSSNEFSLMPYNHYVRAVTPYAEKWEAAEKENTKLREALGKIIFEYNETIDGSDKFRALRKIEHIATEALKPKQ